MSNSRKNVVLKIFYKDLESILVDRARQYGIDLNQLSAYLNPLSNEHIAFYENKYSMKIDLVNRIEDFYFMRFVSSWGNQRYTKFMQKGIVCDQLSQSLNKFDLSSFNYRSANDYLAHMNTFSELKGRTKLAKGIHSIAVYLKKNSGNLLSQHTEYSDKETYIKCVTNIINQGSIKVIDGIGLTLFADFIKEANILDNPKPDLHVLNLYNEIFNNQKKISNVANENQFSRILGFFYDLKITTNKSIYDFN